ncbi:MAG TPA: phage holin family protein [Bacteroidales bacterium]|nr:phage holin family protein [Bacteroidales bacterium]
MKFIIKVLVTALAVMAAAYILEPHVRVESFWISIIVALVLALLNAFVRPVLLFISIPVTILTLGLFIFVINAFIIYIAAYFIDGFNVEGFWWTLLFSIIISFFSSILNSILKTDSPQKK